jgi:DNA mismatch repair protein MutH
MTKYTVSQLIEKAKSIENQKISDIGREVGVLDDTYRMYTKSIIANIVETNFFGIPTNSSEKPDFDYLNIELKVSPLKYVPSRNLYNMKERCVLKMVDYNDVYESETWEDSKLSKKIENILFVFYIHDNNINATEWKFAKTLLWTPNDFEREMISKDYQIIRNKVINGEINSERDNIFLGTCPKHAGGYKKNDIENSKPLSLCNHPVLGRAERRGYCIKQREVDRLIGRHTDWELIEEGKSIGFRDI